MPTNPIVERLRVDRRSLDIYAVPPLPKVSPVEAKRSPELAAYVDRLATTWDHLGATIKDRLLALTDFADSSAALALTKAQVQAIEDKLGAEVAERVRASARFNSQVSGILNSIGGIQGAIEHINNLLAHIFQQLGGSAQMFLFPVDAATWTATHSFERRVTVELFNESWDRFEAFVDQPDSATVIARLVPDGRGAMLIS